MTKDVLVSVRGAHIADGETNNLEVITAGSYYFKNGKHYIIYDEILEGEEGSIRNTIKANADSVDMIKGGDARAHMIFQENRPNVSCYVTPYGQMIVGVTTDRIKINEGPDHLKIQIDYTLELNYEQTSQSHIEIDVKSKATAAALVVSNNAEQLNKDSGELIDGLYAAGSILSAAVDGEGVLSGNELTEAVVFGSTAGTEAAVYVSDNQ